MHNWWIERFESGLYFLPEEWSKGLCLWYDDDTLVGAIHPRSGRLNEVYIQILPDYRYLEDEMIQGGADEKCHIRIPRNLMTHSPHDSVA